MEEHKEKKEHNPKDANAGEASTHGSSDHGKKEIKIAVPEIKGLNWATISTAAAIILLIIAVFQTYRLNSISESYAKMEAKSAELHKLPAVQVIAIDTDCAQCTPIASILSTVTSAQANITQTTSLKPTDLKSRQLISEYSIKRLPTVVVTGETGKLKLADAGFAQVGNALVYTQTAPPYVDAATGAVKGLVTLTLVNASGCAECTDLMPALQQLRGLVTVKDAKIVDKDSADGAALVEKYSMSRLPGILISNDVAEYPVASQLAKAGTPKQDGTIAVGANPPYFNTSTGKVDGIASLILLNDSSCAQCYDVTMHIPIVKRGFQIYLGSTKVVDAGSAEGKSLISKYNIMAVPTILLTGDMSVYGQLNAIWKTVGTVESDGTYVFRAMSAIAGRPYMNLTTGKVELNPAPQQPQQQ